MSRPAAFQIKPYHLFWATPQELMKPLSLARLDSAVVAGALEISPSDVEEREDKVKSRSSSFVCKSKHLAHTLRVCRAEFVDMEVRIIEEIGSADAKGGRRSSRGIRDYHRSGLLLCHGGRIPGASDSGM